jgi:RNA polymerase sigma-70 factor (ECF subfamily)
MARIEEAELLAKAQGGDVSARETLYADYFLESKQIRGLLAREVRNPDEREDVLHDAYLSLIRTRSDFRGEARLATFVYRVVQFTILQKLRRERSRREDMHVRLTFESAGEERERELAVTDYQFEQVEAGALADKLLALVPEPLRTTFRMRVLDEMSYEEIAAAENCPVNTVATRIFKARTLLAKLFAGGEQKWIGTQRT